jgi:hypothetical protein
MTNVGPLTNGDTPESLNDSDAFVGYSAFIYSNGTFQNLINLIPANSGYTSSARAHFSGASGDSQAMRVSDL